MKKYDYECKICQFNLYEPEKLEEHLKTYHPKEANTYRCGICQLQFNFLYELVFHKQVMHSKQEVFKCTECGKTFENEIFLKRHISNEHTQAKSHSVKIENQEFCSSNDLPQLKVEQECDDNEKTSEQSCSEQEKTSTRRGNICQFCGKSFSANNNRLKHIRNVHRREKQYRCQICLRLFGSKSDLSEHLQKDHAQDPVALLGPGENVQAEGGEKSYPCKFCDKIFFRTESIRYHLRSVHCEAEGKFYECHICKEEFSFFRDLVVHKRVVHENVKFYGCAKCFKKFLSLDRLTRHLEKCGKETIASYKCKICKQEFSIEGDLLYHKKYVLIL